MARTDTARLFAALAVPSTDAERLGAWARQVARAGRTREGPGWLRVLAAESVHLTLVFLGERPLSELDVLAEAMQEAAGPFGPMEVELGAPLWLPPRRPRALAVEAHERTGALERLQGAVAGSLWQACGESAPHSRFRAHVTVARTKAAGRVRGELPVTPAVRFAVEEVVLFRSRLEPEGARYERLAGAQLVGMAP
jgi:2'-5' RNA ligase